MMMITSVLASILPSCSPLLGGATLKFYHTISPLQQLQFVVLSLNKCTRCESVQVQEPLTVFGNAIVLCFVKLGPQ